MSKLLDNSASRAAVLGKVKSALQIDESGDTQRRQVMEKRLKDHKRGLIPKHGQLSEAERCKLFINTIEKLSGSAVCVKSLNDIPNAIAAYLKKHNLEPKIKAGPDPRLMQLDWLQAPMLEVSHGRALDQDKTGLTYAESGIAETGSLVLTSSGDNPMSLNFMPDNSIVVVDAKSIDACHEDGFDRVRKRNKNSTLPRAITLVTGPSRTADIEQQIEFGAHGPKNLHVIVVG